MALNKHSHLKLRTYKLVTTAMNKQKSQCAKCNGEMIAGVNIVTLGLYSGQVTWMELKLKDSVPLPLTSDEVEKYNIETYRCIKCGYLESYTTTRSY